MRVCVLGVIQLILRWSTYHIGRLLSSVSFSLCLPCLQSLPTPTWALKESVNKQGKEEDEKKLSGVQSRSKRRFQVSSAANYSYHECFVAGRGGSSLIVRYPILSTSYLSDQKCLGRRTRP